MRGIRFVLFLGIVSSLTGCGIVQGPAPVSVKTQTPTVPPFVTTRPSKTAIAESEQRKEEAENYIVPTVTAGPTSTLEPPLQTKGPYFAYFRAGVNGYQLVMRDANGVGRNVITLPGDIADAYPNKQRDLTMKLVSPDGRWLAFHTGFAGEMGKTTTAGPYDLALNLLDLTTGEVKVVTPLLSKDYPDNFTRAAKTLNNPEITADGLQWAFLNGVTSSLAWSPDGQHLAFAGQMDGLSSDLYVYDVNPGRIRRLSSGDQELQWINWSPDGKWILHGSVFNVGMGMVYDIYAAAMDGASVRYLSTATNVGEWLNSHTYFENDSQNGPGDYGLRLVNVETGKTTKLWDGAYFSYASNRAGNLVIVNAMLPDVSPYSYTGDDPSFVPGPYLIDLATLHKTQIEIPSNEVPIDDAAFAFGLNGQEFLWINSSSSYFLSEKLELSPIDLKDAKIAVSPDLNYWAAMTEKVVNIYSRDNVLIYSLPLSLQDLRKVGLTWNPDTSGLFIISESNIYFVDILKGQIELMETHLASSFWDPVYLWVGNQ